MNRLVQAKPKKLSWMNSSWPARQSWRPWHGHTRPRPVQPLLTRSAWRQRRKSRGLRLGLTWPSRQSLSGRTVLPMWSLHPAGWRAESTSMPLTPLKRSLRRRLPCGRSGTRKPPNVLHCWRRRSLSAATSCRSAVRHSATSRPSLKGYKPRWNRAKHKSVGRRMPVRRLRKRWRRQPSLRLTRSRRASSQRQGWPRRTSSWPALRARRTSRKSSPRARRSCSSAPRHSAKQVPGSRGCKPRWICARHKSVGREMRVRRLRK
mmetsp:Transcript_90576/g.255712  ORF Transcript_90576/g.255712 Transcript_90576/m.255712 type:complete len:262 (+) Transcript_90576:1151-1936(+)